MPDMENMITDKSLIQALQGCETDNIPFWFMRQAGRYLPEYRELRKQAGGFLNLVYNPENASEVTMQPIRRFGMNGAILFSDILVIPQALGQDLRFEIGEGPKLNALETEADLAKLSLEKIDQVLSPIYDTVSLTAAKLSEESFKDTTLLGFAGSPWTIACYMIEGGGSKTFEKTKKWAYQKPDSFQKLIDLICEASIYYLGKQVETGAEAVQLFDSWSGILDETNFEKWSIAPTRKISDALKEKYPDLKIIGFPREAGAKAINYVKKAGVDVLGLDFSVPVLWAKENFQTILPVQGNLDPVSLLAGGQQMEKAAMNILEAFSDKPFIFNLGHGVIKETPVEHVEKLSQIIKDFRS